MFDRCLDPREPGQSVLENTPGFAGLTTDAGLAAIARLFPPRNPRPLKRRTTPSVPAIVRPPEFRTELAPDLLPCIITGRAAPPWVATRCGRHIGFTPDALQEAAERIESGKQSCFLAWLHEPETQLADVESGTLDVFFQRCEVADFDGLAFRARLQNDSQGRQVVRYLATGKMGASLGFASDPNWVGGTDLKTEADIFELSFVDAPAYGSAAWVKVAWLVSPFKANAILYGTD
jgi:hypothetical protein